MGSLRDLAEFHRAPPISTWAGQNLGSTSLKTTQVQGLQERQLKVTLREGFPSIEETMVMVQEDQAGEPWSSYVGLYTGMGQL